MANSDKSQHAEQKLFKVISLQWQTVTNHSMLRCKSQRQGKRYILLTTAALNINTRTVVSI